MRPAVLDGPVKRQASTLQAEQRIAQVRPRQAAHGHRRRDTLTDSVAAPAVDEAARRPTWNKRSDSVVAAHQLRQPRQGGHAPLSDDSSVQSSASPAATLSQSAGASLIRWLLLCRSRPTIRRSHSSTLLSVARTYTCTRHPMALKKQDSSPRRSFHGALKSSNQDQTTRNRDNNKDIAL